MKDIVKLSSQKSESWEKNKKYIKKKDKGGAENFVIVYSARKRIREMMKRAKRWWESSETPSSLCKGYNYHRGPGAPRYLSLWTSGRG